MKQFKNILNDCKHAQQIGIEKEQQSINLKKWLQLKIHMIFCKYCRIFLKQSNQINKFIQSICANNVEKYRLSREKKEEIQSEILKALNK